VSGEGKKEGGKMETNETEKQHKLEKTIAEN